MGDLARSKNRATEMSGGSNEGSVMSAANASLAVRVLD
jgi:hypothetical protein